MTAFFKLSLFADFPLLLAASGSSKSVSAWIWGAFLALIVLLLVVDLKLVMRKPHKITTKEAAMYSAAWITLGLLFTFVIWIWIGGQAASEYITGYLIEESLSLDNVFLWAILFSFFAVPKEYQHRVLFWGIFGALVLRAAFIFGGVVLLDSIHWVIYIFGGLLLFTAYRIYTHDETQQDPSKNPIIQFVKKHLPQTDEYKEDYFFVKEQGKRLATPLLTVLVVIELSDIIFAIDSIPAILAVTRKQFIVFSSNAFAILGLRALYFLLADIKDRFIYLNEGLAVILAFVGVKFLISELWEVPIWLSLAFIAVVITLTVVLSLRATRKKEEKGEKVKT